MSNARVQLEIAANSAASALAAQAGGADRVELCENLGDGGCTPSMGTLAVLRDRLDIGLHVLIRPRAGDFLFDALDAEVMLADIAHCVRIGCDGVVIGALDADGGLDLALCRELVAAAGPLQVTFHRAFDAARDRARALEQIIALGCARILTSGGAATASDGAAEIARHAAAAAGRIELMAGAGVTPGNIADIARRSHADALHASAKALRRSGMRHQNPALSGLDNDWLASDAGIVAALHRALEQGAATD